jgi:hypothetical protein
VPLFAINVHLTSQESWWNHNLGALVLAGAAFLAALITILDRRRALRNDRYIKRMEHFRGRIDEALMALTNTQLVLGRFYATVKVIEDFRAQQRELAAASGQEEDGKRLESLEKEAKDRLGELRTVTRPAIEELAVTGITLHVRLGSDQDLFERFDGARESAMEFFLSLSDGVDDNRSDKVRDADAKLNKARYAAQRRFNEACLEWFESESPTLRRQQSRPA